MYRVFRSCFTTIIRLGYLLSTHPVNLAHRKLQRKKKQTTIDAHRSSYKSEKAQNEELYIKLESKMQAEYEV